MHKIIITRAMVVTGVGLLALLLARFGIDVDPATRDLIVESLAWGLPVAIPAVSALWARKRIRAEYREKAEDPAA